MQHKKGLMVVCKKHAHSLTAFYQMWCQGTYSYCPLLHCLPLRYDNRLSEFLDISKSLLLYSFGATKFVFEFMFFYKCVTTSSVHNHRQVLSPELSVCCFMRSYIRLCRECYHSLVLNCCRCRSCHSRNTIRHAYSSPSGFIAMIVSVRSWL